MKRGILFGLGSFLILCVIYGLIRAVQSDYIAAVIALALMPVSVIVIRAAKRAAPHVSRWQTVFGWMLGFFAINAVFGIFAAIMIFS